MIYVQWEDVSKCNFCGGEAFSEYLNSTKPLWFDGRPLILCRCDNCDLVFANPRPTRVDANEEYLAGDELAVEAIERKNARNNVYAIHRKVIATATEHLGRKPLALYDMGFGSGSLLEVAKEEGLEAWGNEVNKAAVDRLRSMGINALFGFTGDVDAPTGHFDIVTNLDYIEHTYQPMDDLRECHRLAAPGGILYLKTLYLDCAAHLMAEDSWHLLGRPSGESHLHYFWPRVIRDMVVKAGFTVLDIQIGQLISIIARRDA